MTPLVEFKDNRRNVLRGIAPPNFKNYKGNRNKMEKKFESLIHHFQKLAKISDAGIVKGDFRCYLDRKELEGTVESLSFFIEDKTFVIHRKVDETFRLVIEKDEIKEIFEFREKDAVVRKVNKCVSEMLQLKLISREKVPLPKKICDNRENSTHMLTYLEDESHLAMCNHYYNDGLAKVKNKKKDT